MILGGFFMWEKNVSNPYIGSIPVNMQSLEQYEENSELSYRMFTQKSGNHRIGAARR